MTKEELIQMAVDKGFARADTITPAHILDCTNPRIVEVPDKVFIYADTLGNIFYRDSSDSKGCADLKEINHPTNTWSGMIYCRQNNRWAKIMSYKDGEEELKEFPSTGVCWNPNTHLLKYLKARSTNTGGHSVTSSDLINRGLAWNLNGIWTVSTCSNRQEYKLAQLLRVMEPQIPDELALRPLTPQECYLPEKWCTIITKENADVLSKFLVDNKDSYPEYDDRWNPIDAKSFYFIYPPSDLGAYASSTYRKGYTLIDSDKIIHVLTNKNQIINTLKTEENGKSNTIKVQRPYLSVRDTGEIRATGLRRTKVQIKIGSGHCPN